MWCLSVLFADSIGLNTEAPRHVAPVCIVCVDPCAARLGSRHQPSLRRCWRPRREKLALAPGLDCVWRARGEKLALAPGLDCDWREEEARTTRVTGGAMSQSARHAGPARRVHHVGNTVVGSLPTGHRAPTLSVVGWWWWLWWVSGWAGGVWGWGGGS